MKLLVLIAVVLSLVFAGTVSAHPGHKHKRKPVAVASLTCYEWAIRDPAHGWPAAAYPYGYRCINPGGDWTVICGYSSYGFFHKTKLHRTSYGVVVASHGHGWGACGI